MSEQKELPWICEDHPDAQVRHLYDLTHYVMNGYPSGEGIRSNHRYECAVCQRELAAGTVHQHTQKE